MLRNALCLFILTVVVLALFIPSYQKMQDLRAKNAAYLAEIEKLKQERLQLMGEKKRLETDPAYLEKVGREEMHLIRQGEVVYKLVPVNEVKEKAGE